MVAGKLDPTIDQLCFRRNFQTVRNLQKGTTEMSSEGPKIMGRRYGLADNALKSPENEERSGDPRATVAAAAASSARSNRVRLRLAGKFYRRDHQKVEHLPGRRVLQVDGRWCLLWSKTPRLANGSKRPNSVFTILESFS